MPRPKRSAIAAAIIADGTEEEIAAAIAAAAETNITFRVPRRLHDRLKAAGGPSGMSEQIRRRLETSLAQDRPSEQLIEAIAHLTRLLARDGNWHEDAFLHQVLTAAVHRLMEHWRPVTEPPTPRQHNLIEPKVSAEAAGRMLAATVLLRGEP